MSAQHTITFGWSNGMWIQAHAIRIVDGEPLGDDADENDALVRDGEGLEVGYWVGIYPVDDRIQVEDEGEEHWTLDDAVEVAAAIKRLLAWSRTKAGKARIAKLREKVSERS